ncbi:PLP-dependent aminotransferase family protein [Actinomadura kijaniata]|uniref:GntR family transcriptional regulator/MocR family aminotransferase n=1 Tax=Actinomadura namibiensis TaxID=182080 RepID=A0A7W3M045_ACTNM|nr:PLP-dependent aminotransferase family protein [Actinomadura namibiensis]MBA8957407.1 GntR family transcriptional regulator/MocR family aminotransferase [Actinomadura namibiensis]
MADQWPNSGLDLHLEIDPTVPGRRAGLEKALRDAVQDGRLAPGARLPATRRLADELGLSRGTVRAAYDQLIAEGYLTARQGAGTTVARLPRPHGDGAEPPAPPDRPRHDLRPGSPDVSAFPRAAWLLSARRALTAAPADAFGYGDPRGRPELRAALAEYLGRTRGVLARPGQIVITNGYSQALGLLARVTGGVVAMEDPGVGLHRDIVRHAGAHVAPLPVDDRGARTDLLTGSVTAVEVTPAHQYPTGRTLHPCRRRALVTWARDTGGLIIENDYDGEFRYDRQPVGAVQGTAPDHVAYLGTASKTLGPVLRLAWMVLPPRLLEPVVEAKRLSDHHTEGLGQLTLADFIAGHAYDRHIRASRLRYRRRRDRLVAALAPSGLSAQGIAAGLQALVPLHPDGPAERDVLAAAARHGLALGHLGDRWHTVGENNPQGLIIGYARPPEHAYPAALDALATVLRAVLPG